MPGGPHFLAAPAKTPLEAGGSNQNYAYFPILEWLDEHAKPGHATDEFSNTIQDILRRYTDNDPDPYIFNESDPIELIQLEINRPEWTGTSPEPLGGTWLRMWTALYLFQDAALTDPALKTPEWQWTAFSTPSLDDWQDRLENTTSTEKDSFGLARPARANPTVTLPALANTEFFLGSGQVQAGGAHFQDAVFPDGCSGTATIRVSVNSGRKMEASVTQFSGANPGSLQVPDVCIVDGTPLISLSSDMARSDADVIEIPITFGPDCPKVSIGVVHVDPNSTHTPDLHDVVVEVEIHDLGAAITTNDLPDGESGRAYPPTQLTSTVPGVWSIVSGAPEDMRISPSGLLTGKPNGGDNYDIVIGLTVDGHLSTKEFHVSIDGPRFVTDNSFHFIIFLPGGGFERQIVTTVHGIPDKSTVVTLDVDDFPPGITMDTSGLITGTTSEYGTYDFILLATDSRGLTAGRTYRIWVTSL